LNSLDGQMVLLTMIANTCIQFRDEVATIEQVLKVRAQSLGQVLSSVSVDALLDVIKKIECEA